MMLWTALYLSAACAYGSVIPRAPDVSLATLIRDSREVQGHMKSIRRAMTNAVPYSEGLLQDSESVKWGYVTADERKCMYLRNSVKPDSLQATLDLNPHEDYPDQISGDEPMTIEVTSSVAKIDAERLGWNKEDSSEVGGSATVEASAGFGFFSASLSATVHGNQRWTNGQNGEASKQTEFKTEMTSKRTCPRNSICRIVTWTYVQTISGTCFLMPYLDAKCLDGGKDKYSLGLFPFCQPLAGVASQFFDFDQDKIKAQASPGFGPDLQGIKMHKPELVRTNKHEENCTFSYALRMENGDPVKAQAIIIEPLDSQPEPPEVTEVPKAIEWEYDHGDQNASCKLENGWFWERPYSFCIPKSSDEPCKWWSRKQWPKPEGHEEKCPNSTGIIPRAVADDDAAPPMNDLVKVEIITDNIQEFVSQLEKHKSDGLAANITRRSPFSAEYGLAALHAQSVLSELSALAQKAQQRAPPAPAKLCLAKLGR